MKLKKIIALVLSVITAGTCLAATGCSASKQQISKDPKTVNLMMSAGGYGTDYIDEIIAKFNETYKEEGYKIHRLEPSNTFGTADALGAMRNPKSGYDLVFPGSVYAYDALEPYPYFEKGCVECLDDVYASKALKFNGEEEELTVAQKLRTDEYSNWTALDVNDVVDGEWYGFFRTDSYRGLVCNTTVMKEYGGMTDFEKEYPATTNELFKYYDKIAETGSELGKMPVIYGGDNAATYSVTLVQMCIGQILGKEAANEFFNMEELYAANGNKWYSDDWKYCIENESLIPTLEVLLQAWDYLYAVNGSSTIKHNIAHGRLMSDLAAFMFDGNYFYTEVKANYGSELDKIRMVPYPMISYVGVKNDLCGAGHEVGYGKNSGVKCEECDKILSVIVRDFDAEMSKEATKADVQAKFPTVNITDEQIDSIFESRSCTYGISEPCYIIKDSPKADIAKLFLRMLASDDAAKVYEKYGMMSIYKAPEITEDTPTFIADCFKYTRARTWGVDVHSTPSTKKVLFSIPGYSATIGVSIHEQMQEYKNESWKDRNYVKIAREILGEGGFSYDKAASTFEKNVKTRKLIYDSAKNPNR